MFKKTLLLALVAIAAMPSWAVQNSVQVANQTIAQGTTQATLTVNLTNNVEISDMQFDLYLPTGFSVAYDEDEFPLIAIAGDRTTDKKHSIDYLARTDGSMRVMCTSSKGYTFSGDNGAVLQITLNVASDVAVGTYSVQMKKIRISNSDSTFKPADFTSSITLTRIPVTHSLTYVVDGNTYQTETYEEGAAITPLAEPTKEGYTFSGWSETPATMGTEDITITGTFAINKYKITYIVDGITLAEDSIAYGSAITPLAEPTKEGYTFSGWSEIPATMGTEDITVTGTFTENAIPVTDPDTDISQHENIVYVNHAEGRIGEKVTLPVMMNNTGNVYGFQFELCLPENITVSVNTDEFGYSTPDVTLSGTRTSSARHTLSSSINSEGILTVLCYSTEKKNFVGTEGEVAQIVIEIPDDMPVGEYPIIIQNEVISKDDVCRIERIKSSITIVDYKLGDANGDNSVDVGDITTVAGHILKLPEGTFVEKAADANSDGSVDVGDITTIAGWILDGTANSAHSKIFKAETHSAEISIDDLCTTPGSELTVPVMVSNSTSAFSSFQFDINVPEGFKITGVIANNTRMNLDIISYAQIADGITRVLGYSLKDDRIKGTDGTMAYITLKAEDNLVEKDYDLKLENAIFACKSNVFSANNSVSTINVSNDLTGIGTSVIEDSVVDVYNIQGNIVRKGVNALRCLEDLPKGIYIVNGKKITK